MNVQDRRRLLGPANAKPIVFSKAQSSSVNDEVRTNVKESIVLESGMLKNCNGSSLVEFENGSRQSSAITSVYGPRAIKGSFTSQAALTISLKNGSIDKYTSLQLKEAGNFLTSVFKSVVNLSRYPKSGIDVFLHIIYDKEFGKTDSGVTGLLPHLIHGITLALIDAGIEIIDIASASCHLGNVFAFVKNTEEIVGFWKDEGDSSDITESLKRCKKQSLHYKKLMIGHITKQ